MTPQELIAKWRDEAERKNQRSMDKRVDDEQRAIAAGECYGLNDAADELASTLRGMRCATCVHRDGLPGEVFWCKVLQQAFAPDFEANGQPFSCSAWAASPPLEGK